MTAGIAGGELLERVRQRLAGGAQGISSAAVAEAVRAESSGVVGDVDVLRALRVAHEEFVGAGPLEPLLRADGVTDVLVTGPDEVWVDGEDGLRRSSVRFADEDAVRRLAQRMAMGAGRRLDEAQPFVDAWLPAGGHCARVRLHAVLPPVAAAGTCISLRVLRPVAHDLAGLRALGTFDEPTEHLLRALVHARLAFVVAGATGAGKSTLLSALLACVPATERIVCVEDVGELEPHHPQFVRLVARPPNIEGAGEVSQRELVRQALRMRPDRLVVGEVRGAEVCELLTALNTGHDGGAGTVHANSPAEVPARLEALAALGGLARAALHSQLAAAIRLLLHVRRDRSGARRLTEIGMLGRNRDEVTVAPVWRAGEKHAAELDALLRDRGVSPPC